MERQDLTRGVLLAVVVHVPLLYALAASLDWKLDWNRSNETTAAAPRATAAPRPGTPAADRPAPAAQAARSTPSQAVAAAPAGRSTAGAAAAPAVRTVCPLRPLLAPAGAKDGQVLPPASVSNRPASEIASLLTAGKEAAASGLRHDAEVSLLTACRIADAAKGKTSIDAADTRYQLGWHYAAIAGAETAAPAAARAELLRAAEAYYNDSAQVYAAQLGGSHEKARFAADGLASVRSTLAQLTGTATAGAAAAPAAAPASAAASRERRSTRERGGTGSGTREAPAPRAGSTSSAAPPDAAAVTARASAPRTPVAPAPEPAAAAPEASGGVRQATGDAAGLAPPRPSFDCAKARSTPERLICADAELARLDRELGRLHARAKAAAPDAAAFKRQNDAEWRRREAECRDRDCLLGWYAERRQQLQESLSESRAAGPPDTTVAR
jgi:hypothetical protein